VTQIGVRDSKFKQGPALILSRSSWGTFVNSVGQGKLST
jgi:hypothetical protein